MLLNFIFMYESVSYGEKKKISNHIQVCLCDQIKLDIALLIFLLCPVLCVIVYVRKGEKKSLGEQNTF